MTTTEIECTRSQVRLEKLGRLKCPVEIAYRLEGPIDAPVVAVMGGISAGRDAMDMHDQKGWWSNMVGEGKALDPHCQRILTFDYLGGSGQSTPYQDLKPHLGSNPWISTHDQASTLRKMCASLHIERLDLVVGASYGGMVALALAEQFPEFVKKQIVISAAECSAPHALALRSIQRGIVQLGRGEHAKSALNLARQLAMLTYRTTHELNTRFRGKNAGSEILSYLQHCGDKFTHSFDGPTFVNLSESIDRHKVCPEKIETPTLLIGVQNDQLIPAWQLESLALNLAGPCNLKLFSSIYGHDAFLKETETLTKLIRKYGGIHDPAN